MAGVKEFLSNTAASVSDAAKASISQAASGITAKLLSQTLISQYLGDAAMNLVLNGILQGSPVKAVPQKLADGLNKIAETKLKGVFGRGADEEGEKRGILPDINWSVLVANLQGLDPEAIIKEILTEADVDDAADLVKLLEGTVV